MIKKLKLPPSRLILHPKGVVPEGHVVAKKLLDEMASGRQYGHSNKRKTFPGGYVEATYDPFRDAGIAKVYGGRSLFAIVGQMLVPIGDCHVAVFNPYADAQGVVPAGKENARAVRFSNWSDNILSLELRRSGYLRHEFNKKTGEERDVAAKAAISFINGLLQDVGQYYGSRWIKKSLWAMSLVFRSKETAIRLQARSIDWSLGGPGVGGSSSGPNSSIGIWWPSVKIYNENDNHIKNYIVLQGDHVGCSVVKPEVNDVLEIDPGMVVSPGYSGYRDQYTVGANGGYYVHSSYAVHGNDDAVAQDYVYSAPSQLEVVERLRGDVFLVGRHDLQLDELNVSDRVDIVKSQTDSNLGDAVAIQAPKFYVRHLDYFNIRPFNYAYHLRRIYSPFGVKNNLLYNDAMSAFNAYWDGRFGISYVNNERKLTKRWDFLHNYVLSLITISADYPSISFSGQHLSSRLVLGDLVSGGRSEITSTGSWSTRIGFLSAYIFDDDEGAFSTADHSTPVGQSDKPDAESPFQDYSFYRTNQVERASNWFCSPSVDQIPTPPMVGGYFDLSSGLMVGTYFHTVGINVSRCHVICNNIEGDLPYTETQDKSTYGYDILHYDHGEYGFSFSKDFEGVFFTGPALDDVITAIALADLEFGTLRDKAEIYNVQIVAI